MTRQEIIDYCLTLPGAYEDYPFDTLRDNRLTTVMRHRQNKKSFAMIMSHNGKLYLNLKCDPFEADFLRGAYKSIIPGWHMNKIHWNTIIMDGDGYKCDVCEDEIKRQINNSFDLIKPKVEKR